MIFGNIYQKDLKISQKIDKRIFLNSSYFVFPLRTICLPWCTGLGKHWLLCAVWFGGYSTLSGILLPSRMLHTHCYINSATSIKIRYFYVVAIYILNSLNNLFGLFISSQFSYSQCTSNISLLFENHWSRCWGNWSVWTFYRGPHDCNSSVSGKNDLIICVCGVWCCFSMHDIFWIMVLSIKLFATDCLDLRIFSYAVIIVIVMNTRFKQYTYGALVTMYQSKIFKYCVEHNAFIRTIDIVMK